VAVVEVRVTLGDLTRTRADALVNAANSSLLGGGGVDGALHRVGGPTVLAACRRLRATSLPDGLPPGRAAVTTAGALPARHLIHVVGPVYRAGQADELRPLLASCYTEALRLAGELGAGTVAAPAVSAGAYGWPLDDAARTAVRAARASTAPVRELVFVLNNPAAHTAFLEALESSAGPG
jgi:O-acetyl-ADP-ribose deacetylase (regulator of RNase III)